MSDLAKKEQIFNRFPKIFLHKNSGVKTPEQLWIENGWLSLFEKFCKQINTLAEIKNVTDDQWPHFTQVKQKLGGLRMHMWMWGFDEDDKAMALQYNIEARQAADFTCEGCSAPGTLRREGDLGWIHVYCDACQEHLLKTGERP